MVGSLKQAHGEGMQNKHWWQKALDVVSDVLSKITIVLLVGALVAIVVLAIVQPELIPGLLVLAGEMLTALSAAQLATDGARKAIGENVSWGSLGMDALGALPGLGELGIGMRGAEMGAKLAETMPRAAQALTKTADVIRTQSVTGRLMDSLGGSALAKQTTRAIEYTRGRASELQNLVPEASRGRVTMASGVGKDADGNIRTVVGTSEARGYLRKGVELKDGEKLATGNGHAETSIINYMKENGIKPLAVGAGRPVCPPCVDVLNNAGSVISTPLKAVKQVIFSGGGG